MEESVIRPLKHVEIEQAARIISQAFLDDPLCTFMLPFKRTRVTTLRKFFRAYGAVNIQNQCGYGIGVKLKGVAYWIEPTKPDISMTIKSLGTFLPLLFTMVPIGYLRAKAILKQIDLLHQKHAPEPH